MSSTEEYGKYNIAHAALVGVLIVPSTVLWISALCLARRKGDPARRFTTLFKTAFILWSIFLFWDTISYTLFLINIYINDYFNFNTYPQVAQAGDRTFYFGRLCDCFGQLALLLTLVELGFGILHALYGARSPLHRLVRFGALGLVALLAVLELAHFGLAQSFYSDLYGPTGTAFYRAARPVGAMLDKLLNARRLFLAFVALLFVASVGVAVFAILVSSKVGKATQLRKPATFFLVCAMLWLLRNTWAVAAHGSWSGIDCYTCISYPIYFEVLDPILNVWVTFVIMVLLFALAVKKQNGGLWTIDPRAPPPAVSQFGSYAPPPQGYIYAGPPPPVQQQYYTQPAYPAPTQQRSMPHGQAVPLEDVKSHVQTNGAPAYR